MSVPMGARVSACAGILALAACTGVKDVPQANLAEEPKACSSAGDRSALAGSWLYEEQGYIDTLSLDEQGNGAYLFGDGRIQTACLDRSYWIGSWKQAEGEGRFEIKLSKDLGSGKGRRWSVRTAMETAPQALVSEFQVKRIGAVGQLSPPTAADASPIGAGAAPR
jgi:hypothetical protein